jgi:hypothetical protein
MPTCEARIATDRAQRYLDQLCSHLGQMQHMRHLPASGHGGAGVPRVEHIEQTSGSALIRFADGAWTLEANQDALLLRVEADSPAALERLKTAIAARIAKIGRRDDLTVAWHCSEEPGPDDGPNGAGTGTVEQGRRTGGRRWRRLGWFAALGLAAAIHLGLIGSLLGSGRWKDVTADVIITLVAVKLILLALHTRFGRGAGHTAGPRAHHGGPATFISDRTSRLDENPPRSSPAA